MSTLPHTPPKEPTRLDDDGLPPASHLFDRRELLALRAALVTGRPLLVKGEPGTGKSQLARAAARVLDRAYVHHAVDHRTEVRDLRWRVDNVARLTNAQLASTFGPGQSFAEGEDPREVLNFVQPGPLWWAFAWDDAAAQAKRAGGTPCGHAGRESSSGNGVVVLIDEIDKADPAVPEGLLDALGHGVFNKPAGGLIRQGQKAPLVLITTNETRALSPAFERRCLVLRLAFPEEPAALTKWLEDRGSAHYPNVARELLSACAGMLAEERAELPAPPRPGLAEYLDLLAAAKDITEHPGWESEELMEQLAAFTVGKHRKVD